MPIVAVLQVVSLLVTIAHQAVLLRRTLTAPADCSLASGEDRERNETRLR